MANTENDKETLPGNEGKKEAREQDSKSGKQKTYRNQFGRVKKKDDRFDDQKPGDLGPSS